MPAFYAHRLGAAEVGAPSNCLAGFEGFLELREGMPEKKIEGIETDCSITADGDLALIHWALLELETDQHGWIHEQPTAVARRARLKGQDHELTDEPIMFAEELFDMLVSDERAKDLRVLFEIKSYDNSEVARETAERACDMIIEYGLEDRVDILSYWFEAVQAAAAAGVRGRFTTHGNPDPETLIRELSAIGVKAIDYEQFMIVESRLRQFQAAGLDVTTFLPEPPQALIEHHLRLGLNGITVEKPVSLRQRISTF